MTGLDHKFIRHEGGYSDDAQDTVLQVNFRPDETPRDKAEWFRWLGNYCHTYSKLLKSDEEPIDLSAIHDTHNDMYYDKCKDCKYCTEYKFLGEEGLLLRCGITGKEMRIKHCVKQDE